MVLKGAFLSLKMEAEKNVNEQASLVFLFTTLSLYPSVPLFFYNFPFFLKTNIQTLKFNHFLGGLHFLMKAPVPHKILS